jgi:Tfp pilus assembly protein PilV
VDAVRGEVGQAVLIAALVIGIGALAIVGLRLVQDRVLASAEKRSAGEAAVEAAAASIADAYIAHVDSLRAHAFDVPRPNVDVPAVLAHPATLEAARSAASEAAARNGGGFDGVVVARCTGATIEVELSHAGRVHRASLPVDACSPR